MMLPPTIPLKRRRVRLTIQLACALSMPFYTDVVADTAVSRHHLMFFDISTGDIPPFQYYSIRPIWLPVSDIFYLFWYMTLTLLSNPCYVIIRYVLPWLCTCSGRWRFCWYVWWRLPYSICIVPWWCWYDILLCLVTCWYIGSIRIPKRGSFSVAVFRQAYYRSRSACILLRSNHCAITICFVSRYPISLTDLHYCCYRVDDLLPCGDIDDASRDRLQYRWLCRLPTMLTGVVATWHVMTPDR